MRSDSQASKLRNSRPNDFWKEVRNMKFVQHHYHSIVCEKVAQRKCPCCGRIITMICSTVLKATRLVFSVGNRDNNEDVIVKPQDKSKMLSWSCEIIRHPVWIMQLQTFWNLPVKSSALCLLFVSCFFSPVFLFFCFLFCAFFCFSLLPLLTEALKGKWDFF